MLFFRGHFLPLLESDSGELQQRIRTGVVTFSLTTSPTYKSEAKISGAAILR